MVNYTYIVGWARGGTTLAKNLFACFGDTWVSPGSEHDIFEEGPPSEITASNIAVKLHFEGKSRDSLLRLQEQGGGKIMFLIRDPRDTVVSNWNDPAKRDQPYINCPSGVDLQRNCALICDVIDEMGPLLIKYEDLCRHPDQTQLTISEYFDLEIIHLFSKGNEKYRSIDEDMHVGAMRGGYNKNPLRPIDTTSIGMWESHEGRPYAEEFARIPEVATFIREYYTEAG